jgi:hypothetical protein
VAALAVLLLVEASLASRVILRNNCGGDIQAVWTGNNQRTHHFLSHNDT